MLRKCKDMTFNLKSSVVTSNISSDFISEQYFQLNLNIFLIKVTTPNLSPAANEKTQKNTRHQRVGRQTQCFSDVSQPSAQDPPVRVSDMV